MNLAPDLGGKKLSTTIKKAYIATAKVPKMAQPKAMHQACINLLDEFEGKSCQCSKAL